MPIIRSPRPERDYYALRNSIIDDQRLSWDARAVLVHLLSKPDGWRLNVQALINETKSAKVRTGRDAVYRIIAELIDIGYMTRQRHADGSIEYTIYEEPVTGNPDVASNPVPADPDEGQKPLPPNPDPGNPDPGNPDVLVKTDKAVKTEKAVTTEPSFELSPSAPKQKAKPGKRITLQTFLDDCKALALPPIDEAADPIFEWGAKTGVSRDMLLLAWRTFKDKFNDPGKKQIDWRSHFRNAVKGDWLRLWRKDYASEQWVLTTVGEQAKLAYDLADLEMASSSSTYGRRMPPSQAQLDEKNARAKALVFGSQNDSARGSLWPTKQERIAAQNEVNGRAWLGDQYVSPDSPVTVDMEDSK